MGSSNRRVLNQSTQSSVANSTASRCRHGPLRRITSVLNRPMMVSASALSYESPRLPTDGAMPASASRSVYPHRHILPAAIAVMHQACGRIPAPVVDRLFQGIEHKVRVQRRGHPPADDPPREDVNDEGHVHK